MADSTSCDMGTYYDSVQNVCKFIPPGYYSYNLNSATYLACSVGFYSPGNATTCLKCPVGYTSYPAASACYACPAGTYSTNYGSCATCPTGRVSLPGSSVCSACPAGKTSFYGSNACLISTSTFNCKAGEYLVNGACNFCPAGTYSSGSYCNSCYPGTFSPVGSDQCYSCPSGTFSSSYGSSTCMACAAGQHSYGGDSYCYSYCNSWNVLVYNGNSPTCMSCPSGYVPNTNKTSCSKCGPGTYSSSDSCLPCNAGTSSSLPSNGQCSSCTGAISGSASCFTGICYFILSVFVNHMNQCLFVCLFANYCYRHWLPFDYLHEWKVSCLDFKF